jgi:lipopolysaccharide transport system permease protein
MGLTVRVNAPARRGAGGLRVVVQHFEEVWRHGPLLWALVVREVRARYRNSVLGYLWTLLNPLLLLLVYSLVFSIYMRMNIPDYALFLYSGLLPWLWLSSVLGIGTTSIVNGGSLITKAMLPPQILPTVYVFTNLVNMVLSIPVLLAVALVVGRPPAAALVYLPLLIFAELMLVQGMVLALSALCVRLRDVEFLVTNFLTLWFFLTPIIYSLDFVPARFRTLELLNPMAPVALAYQEIFYDRTAPHASYLLIALVAGAVVLYLGTWIFENLRDSIAEEI